MQRRGEAAVLADEAGLSALDFGDIYSGVFSATRWQCQVSVLHTHV